VAWGVFDQSAKSDKSYGGNPPGETLRKEVKSHSHSGNILGGGKVNRKAPSDKVGIKFERKVTTEASLQGTTGATV